MAGLSITLCKVDEKLKALLTAPAEIPMRVF
jgi:dihydroxyacetone kinase-like protein